MQRARTLSGGSLPGPLRAHSHTIPARQPLSRVRQHRVRLAPGCLRSLPARILCGWKAIGTIHTRVHAKNSRAQTERPGAWRKPCPDGRAICDHEAESENPCGGVRFAETTRGQCSCPGCQTSSGFAFPARRHQPLTTRRRGGAKRERSMAGSFVFLLAIAARMCGFSASATNSTTGTTTAFQTADRPAYPKPRRETCDCPAQTP